MVDPTYLSDALRLKYASRQLSNTPPSPLPTVWDSSALLIGVMSFWARYAAATASFHATAWNSVYHALSKTPLPAGKG